MSSSSSLACLTFIRVNSMMLHYPRPFLSQHPPKFDKFILALARIPTVEFHLCVYKCSLNLVEKSVYILYIYLFWLSRRRRMVARTHSSSARLFCHATFERIIINTHKARNASASSSIWAKFTFTIGRCQTALWRAWLCTAAMKQEYGNGSKLIETRPSSVILIKSKSKFFCLKVWLVCTKCARPTVWLNRHTFAHSISAASTSRISFSAKKFCFRLSLY